MAARFNSPPGWPTPPEGWTPPPGWTPDASWPPAPSGWQFWSDDSPAQQDPFAGATDPSATQTLGTSPTQVFPQSGAPGAPGAPASPAGGSGLYSYGPSSGLDQPGPSPYQGPGGGYQQSEGYVPVGQNPGYQGPGGPTPKSRNTTAIIAVVVVAALVVGGLVWGLTSWLGGGDDPDPTVTATTEPATTDAPTDPETSDEPTTDEPTDPATTDSGGGTASGAVDLVGDQPVAVTGYAGTDPIAELRLVEIMPDWQPDGSSVLCSEPENGQYLALRFDITTLPPLANEDPPTYSFFGWEIGAEVDGVAIEASGFGPGLWCLPAEQQIPTEMQPDTTATGWLLLDVPDTVTAVTYETLFDISGTATEYRWVLADQ